jgi:hypothetical protein
MPEICRFYGITIYIFNREHIPPHIHAEYSGYKAAIDIKDGIVKGEMPKRALNLIFEWIEKHEAEIMENWELAIAGKPLKKIEPLS